MHYSARLATPRESAELLEANGGNYSLSQTARFGEAVARAVDEYSYQPLIFEFSDGQRVFLPLVRVRRRPRLLRCFEAMPFSLNGAPAVAEGRLDRDHLIAILEWLRPDMLSLNGSATVPALSESSTARGLLDVVECSSHVMGLAEGMDTIWEKRFSAKVRNQCRAAERKGVEVTAATSAADLEIYHSMYRTAAARWGPNAPSYPRGLFRELGMLLGHGVELKLAYVARRPVAGILLLHGRRSTLYWGAVMLREFGSYSPHNALLRTAIEEACARGMTQFDFGSSGTLESVRTFKESFGAKTVTYSNYVFVSRRYRLLSYVRKWVLRSMKRVSP